MKNGDSLTRTGLFLIIFIATNTWMIEICPSLQDDKLLFFRERDANATSTFATWVVMGIPQTIAIAFVVLALCIPVYFMANLRTGTGHFMIFYAATYLTLIVNLFLGHFVAAITPNTMVNVIIFPGMTLTIQALLSGYSVMASTMKIWYKWGVWLDPALWSSGIQFVNEAHGNTAVFGPVFSYESLLNNYGWNYPISRMFLFLVMMLIAHKFLAYVGLRYIASPKA